MSRFGLQGDLAPAPPGSTFASLSTSAKVYVATVIALGAIVLGFEVHNLSFDQRGLFIELLALGVITATVKVSLPLTRGPSTMSVGQAVVLTSMTLLGTPGAVLVGAAAAWTQCTFRIKAKNPHHRTMFSIATVMLAVWAAGTVFEWVRGPDQGFVSGLLRPIVPSAIAYFLVNTALVAGAVALTSQQSAYRVWTQGFFWSAPSYLVAAGVAVLAAQFVGTASSSWGIVIAAPLYLTYRSYRSFISRIEEEQAQTRQTVAVQLATIEALAQAIEVKDRTTHEHIRRMQVYSEGLARGLGLSEDEVLGIRTASLLLDIGNLAVPEHILTKPGPLTYQEFEKLKIHTRVGADIVRGVPFPYPVSPLILAHHERWDGQGYPNGLAGEEIPIGARVLCVVDFFTAQLADRPYRPARSHSEAVNMLHEHAGTHLDPTVVAKFIELLPALEVDLQRQISSGRLLASSHVDMSQTALADIAGAHLEAEVLYEIAQTLGSSLGLEESVELIASKLSRLLPFTTCALFLWHRGDRLRCRWATGQRAHDITPISGATVEALQEALAQLPPRTTERALRSILVCPLAANGRQVGALAIGHVDADLYGDDHRRLIDFVSRQIGSVVHNSLVFEQTEEASLTDPLTGLANRRAMQLQVEKDLAHAVRQGSTLSVVLFDLDDLKNVNDTYGHHAGDRAIRETAGMLRSMLRPYDLCARYAGDEFVVALIDCDANEAATRLSELQEAVGAARIEAKVGTWHPLAISAGAATYPEDGETLEQLLAKADERMYQNKARRKRAAARTLNASSVGTKAS